MKVTTKKIELILILFTELSTLHKSEVQQEVQYVILVRPPIVTQKFLHSLEQFLSIDHLV